MEAHEHPAPEEPPELLKKLTEAESLLSRSKDIMLPVVREATKKSFLNFSDINPFKFNDSRNFGRREKSFLKKRIVLP